MSTSPVFQVFTLEFTAMPVNHKALFIALRGEDEDMEGTLLNVIGPTLDRENGRAEMWYEKKECRPYARNTLLADRTRLVGTVTGEKLKRLIQTCDGTTAPSRPLNKSVPNCVTWVNNVLVKLKEEEIVEFESDLEDFPEQEVPLVTW